MVTHQRSRWTMRTPSWLSADCTAYNTEGQNRSSSSPPPSPPGTTASTAGGGGGGGGWWGGGGGGGVEGRAVDLELAG